MMPITAADLVAGECFLSNMNFVRKIISVDGETIIFEERGTKAVPRPWEKKDPVPAERFVLDVTREVPEDYDGEAPVGSGR